MGWSILQSSFIQSGGSWVANERDVGEAAADGALLFVGAGKCGKDWEISSKFCLWNVWVCVKFVTPWSSECFEMVGSGSFIDLSFLIKLDR